MYAIIEVKGKQYRVEKGAYVYVPRLGAAPKSAFNCDSVLMIADDKKADYGQPHLKGAKVTGKVLEEVRSDKIVVFKKKRRKGYQVRRGHKQPYTKVLIEKIQA